MLLCFLCLHTRLADLIYSALLARIKVRILIPETLYCNPYNPMNLISMVLLFSSYSCCTKLWRQSGEMRMGVVPDAAAPRVMASDVSAGRF